MFMDVIQHFPAALDRAEHLVFLSFPLWIEWKLAGLDQSLQENADQFGG
jgi:hypothetical protein